MPTLQASLGKGALLKELLNKLEAENMKIAVLIIRQGAVTDVIGVIGIQLTGKIPTADL